MVGKILRTSRWRLPENNPTNPASLVADGSAARASMSGWPTKTERNPAGSYSGGSKGKMHSIRSNSLAMRGMRPRCHAHTCGLM